MNRRTFFGVISAAFIAPKNVPWVHTPNSVEKIAISQIKTVLIEGIPYHYTDGTTGQWLGISRS